MVGKCKSFKQLLTMEWIPITLTQPYVKFWDHLKLV